MSNGVYVRVGSKSFDTIDEANAYLASDRATGFRSLSERKRDAREAWEKLVAGERLSKALGAAVRAGLINGSDTVDDIFNAIDAL